MTDAERHDTTPHYDKSPFAPQWEYHLMTWDIFLTTREWAQEVARAEGYPVYLVGSTLWKSYSRDLDIAIILPLADFEARFGPIPEDAEQRQAYVSRPEYGRDAMLYALTLSTRIRYAKRVDCKMHPDSWFPASDRLLLATPDSRVTVRDWALMDVKGLTK